jgi:hypothetical protein
MKSFQNGVRRAKISIANKMCNVGITLNKQYSDHCEMCGKVVDYKTGGTTNEEGTPYCKSCVEKLSQKCTVCGDKIPIFEMSHVDSKGKPYCPSCASDYR